MFVLSFLRLAAISHCGIAGSVMRTNKFFMYHIIESALLPCASKRDHASFFAVFKVLKKDVPSRCPSILLDASSSSHYVAPISTSDVKVFRFSNGYG